MPRKKKTKESVVEAVYKAGVVGSGGAGFPTHVKLSCSADVLIANGVECEPLLYNDKHVMEDRPKDVIDGLKLAALATGVKKSYIALKRKYTNAARALEQNISSKDKISFFYMEDFYPAGDEQEIVREVTSRRVPPGKIPLDVGAVVSNVTTLAQVADAYKGRPVTSRLISIVGDTPRPCTVEVPIGITFGELMDQTGNTLTEAGRMIEGGIMMGTMVSPDDVVTKTTTALIVLPVNHSRFHENDASVPAMKRRALSACCQCQTCMDICPRYLLGHPLFPHRSMRAMVNTDQIVDSALLCCECGLCTYLVSCPMELSPRRVHQELKKQRASSGQPPPTWQMGEEHNMRKFTRISSHRLKEKLDIIDYDVEPERHTGKLKTSRLKISLKQHIGKGAEPVVQAGQKVKKNDKIGHISQKAVGANIHTPRAGEVSELDDTFIILKSR